ncbi:MAG TPA: hypothetical protein VEW48_08345 [Thermoanaerobaculia bacterium]|nr:hypothetical protein [Thermoanaerobaculia bacterium]
MPDNAQQPFYYSVQTEDATISPNFVYVVDQGQTIASLFGLIFLDGHWQPSPFGTTSLEVSSYGKGGSQMTMHGFPWSPDPSMGGVDVILVLAFNTAIDFTKPLPLDQLATEGSVYKIHSWSIAGPTDETVSYAVKAVMPRQPKKA